MKHLQCGLFLICLFFSFTLKAQQSHFIYIQTDNKQPFYVKLDKTIYSSASSGYLIIPQLKTGSYSFVIGFPKNEWPEQNIRCSVENKDLGYILKNFGDKGWGLFNLQSSYAPSGDQPDAIRKLTEGINEGEQYQTLLGVTGLENFDTRFRSIGLNPGVIG